MTTVSLSFLDPNSLFLLQITLGERQTQVINAFVDDSFERDDLFRLLHLNRLLQPATTDGVARARKRSKGEPAPPNSFK